MNKNIKEYIYWIAFICYIAPCLIYLSKIFYYIENKDIFQLVNYSILACAFLAFSVHTFLLALDAKNEPETTESLYKSPARLGYGLMVLDFLIIFVSAYFNNESIYIRSIIGIIGYICLSLKINYGIFLLIAYYFLSILVVFRISFNDIIYGISKAGLLLYFGLYAYIYIKNTAYN